MKKKQWEPVTYAIGFADYAYGKLNVDILDVSASFKHDEPVRILRAKDYRKLLRLARKATPKRTP